MGAVVNAVFGGASLFAESMADNQAGALKSREYNRAMRAARLQEVDALVQGGRQAGQIQSQGTQLQSQQVVGQAMGNIDTTTGTAALVQQSTDVFSALDAQTALNNARRKALGFQQVQQQLNDAAKEEQIARRNRDIGRIFRAGSYIMNAATAGAGGDS